MGKKWSLEKMRHEREKALRRIQYKKNKDKIRENAKHYYQKNREQILERQSRKSKLRLKRIKNTPVYAQLRERKRLYERQLISQRRQEVMDGKKCHQCGGTKNLVLYGLAAMGWHSAKRLYKLSATKRNVILPQLEILCRKCAGLRRRTYPEGVPKEERDAYLDTRREQEAKLQRKKQLRIQVKQMSKKELKELVQKLAKERGLLT